MKFKKVREHNLSIYKGFVDIFFAFPELEFRCIVVPIAELDLRVWHDNDMELAFYKFYYLMLKDKIECGKRYIIYTDYRSNRNASRLSDLQQILNNTYSRCETPPIRSIQAHDSRQDNLIQLTDVLVGTMQCDWNKRVTAQAKKELVKHVQRRLNFSTLCANSWYWKFKIFAWRPQTWPPMTVGSFARPSVNASITCP